MKLKTALAIFHALEAHRYKNDVDEATLGIEPIFDVRLDAGTAHYDNARSYRIRVTLGGGISNVTAWAWQQVLDQAEAHDLTVVVQNNGLELSS